MGISTFWELAQAWWLRPLEVPILRALGAFHFSTESNSAVRSRQERTDPLRALENTGPRAYGTGRRSRPGREDGPEQALETSNGMDL